jgi:hypothetical protein
MQIWRIYPELYLSPAALPGASFTVQRVRQSPVASLRTGRPFRGLAIGLPHRLTKSGRARRDVVLFASFVTDAGLGIAEQYLDMLERHHADSKILVGVNHGSCQTWLDLLRASHLDITVCRPAAGVTTRTEAAGFVAALDELRRSRETFDLVWFGHNKGGGHAGNPLYPQVRWTIEKRFWSRRDVIDGYFADPRIGLYAPHYFIQWQGNLSQLTALKSMFPSRLQAIATWGVTAFYVMRYTTVQAFVTQVPESLFTEGVEALGGGYNFFEEGMPNLPMLLGLEPYIERGVGRTTLPLTAAADFNVWADERQNHLLARRHLEEWRKDPERFVPGMPRHSVESPHITAALS